MGDRGDPSVFGDAIQAHVTQDQPCSLVADQLFLATGSAEEGIALARPQARITGGGNVPAPLRARLQRIGAVLAPRSQRLGAEYHHGSQQ
ncbi:hypothetical protein G6F21_014687 [Rhizopus arrhizus]|uniref:Uncharacterized protein n=1 Tax=Rhizopus delemar TaxID=936053 RepID=A0A9P6XV71_9FUNG|nr:hypothetical protein G6F21_014687 [Rhizopus arrhizus]KAG1533248.1 hypothetical protein G6F50_015933 [Rhizopus delemar]